MKFIFLFAGLSVAGYIISLQVRIEGMENRITSLYEDQSKMVDLMLQLRSASQKNSEAIINNSASINALVDIQPGNRLRMVVTK